VQRGKLRVFGETVSACGMANVGAELSVYGSGFMRERIIWAVGLFIPQKSCAS
jgi:hypothetical protein